MYSLIFCYDKREWEEPSYLKFLKALQEDTGNIFSYLVSVNIVNICLRWWGGGRGTIYTRVKCPPPYNPHVCFHFNVMIKGIEKSLVIWSFWMPFKRILKTISRISSLWTKSMEGGTIYPGVKSPPSPPPQPSCMLPFLCNDQRDWEEPGHLKFLNALQESLKKSIGRGGGGQSTPGLSVPPPQPSCMLSFLCNDQRDWEEPGHLKFLNAFQEDTENNFSYLVPMNIVNEGGGGSMGGGTIYPGVKCPPPLNSHVCFHLYVWSKGLRRAWSFEVPECLSRGYWKQFLISSPFEHSQWMGWGWGAERGGDNLPPTTKLRRTL